MNGSQSVGAALHNTVCTWVFSPLRQGFALSALALLADDTDGKRGGEGTSRVAGGFMVTLVTGYVLAALVVIAMKRGARTKVCMCCRREDRHLAHSQCRERQDAQATRRNFVDV